MGKSKVTLSPEDAEEFTASLGQILGGGWRQIQLAHSMGVPQALGLGLDEWVQGRLGGYVRMKPLDRREAVKELAASGVESQRLIGRILGVDESTVRSDLDAIRQDAEAAEQPAGNPAVPDDAQDSDQPVLDERADNPAVPPDAADDVAQTDSADGADATVDAPATLIAPDAPRSPDPIAGFVLGDFRKVAEADLADDSVDLIFTDPPYDRRSLPLYGDLAKIAGRVLKPGGSLVCYLGQYQMREVLETVSPALRFWWPLAIVHQGKQLARMREYGVIVGWKPLLWFVKGTRGDKQTFINDIVFSQPLKDGHRWQQGAVEAEYFIDKLCPPDGFVFDPFCGAGTTAIAAAATGRRFLTCDIDEEALSVARGRAIA